MQRASLESVRSGKRGKDGPINIIGTMKMPEYKINVIEETEEFVILEGRCDLTRGSVRGKYLRHRRILKVQFTGTYHFISHIIEGMKKYLRLKGYEVKDVTYR